MLLTKETETLYEARTGLKYSFQKKDTLQIPRRFYCHWTLPNDEIQYKKGKELIDDPDRNCCFNHHVGLPTRKWETDQATTEVIPVPLTHFNYRMMRNYFKHRKYSQNKCRGSGASEILTIRYMIFKYGVMNNIPNHKCIIMPGTSSKLSNEFSVRIKEICDRIPQIYKDGVGPNSTAPKEFPFKKGKIILTSATPDASRGFENVGDLDLEEVGHWGLVDDIPVFYATEGVHEKTQCHITHNTTPRGKYGFYYDLIWSPDATGTYYKHITNWREVVGLPVKTIEELYNIGNIDEKKITSLRKECLEKYQRDEEYSRWYDSFFLDNGKVIPIKEIMDVPIPILDINAIVNDSQTDRSHYDQELDNQFISGENRAIGMFEEEDWKPDDLAGNIQKYNDNISNNIPFNPNDYE